LMMKCYLLIPILTAALDQWIKNRIRMLPFGKPAIRIFGVIEILPSVNTGAAFSVLNGKNTLLILVSGILLILLALYAEKHLQMTRFGKISTMFLIGGGIGNLLDRLLYGGVTDYIRILLFDFPVFNIADIAVVCSAFSLIILLLTNRLEVPTGDKHG